MERFPLDLTRTSWVRYRDTFRAPRTGHRHEGQDIAAPVGTPVLSPAAGRVVHSMLVNERACGFGVVLQSLDRQTRWTLCHFNAQPLVFDGETVEPGEVLGVVGASGNATSRDRHGVMRSHPHLHIARTRRVGNAWVPDNIYVDLLNAQARDMGVPGIERAPETRQSAPTRGARARGVDSPVFATFAMLGAAYWVSRRRQRQ